MIENTPGGVAVKGFAIVRTRDCPAPPSGRDVRREGRRLAAHAAAMAHWTAIAPEDFHDQ
ncbi:hypothetical protein FH063_001971 [Azospirillum argentinense]|uniref:Uncharacterized protein n=1 Tax=Azospirillum argentinense TaxID=2970906 RepID=A0A5B0KP36_9PROT|nr:hypothetical protein FH063_001971 [Azospirillum argentinense]